MAKTREREQIGTRPLLKARDVAERLGVSTDSVYKLMRRGELAYVRVLSDKRVTEDDFERYLQRQLVSRDVA